jgi:hypothetical protein
VFPVTLRARLLATLVLALGLAAAAQARPVMIENGFTLPRPPASALYPLDFWFTGFGAIDGDWLLAGAVSGETPDRTHLVALLYRRNGTTWVFDRVLDDTLFSAATGDPVIRMRNGIAAIADNAELRVYERVSSPQKWTRVLVSQPFSLRPIAFDGRRILNSRGNTCEWDGQVLERPASSWVVTGELDGNSIGCGPGGQANMGSERDIAGNLAAIANYWGDEQEEWEVHVYRQSGGTWSKETVLRHPDPGRAGFWFAGPAIHGEHVLVSSDGTSGTLIMAPATGGWSRVGRILATDNFGAGGIVDQSKVSGDFVLTNIFSVDRQTVSARLFRRVAPAQYEYLAQIVGKNGTELFAADFDGRRVLASYQTQSEGYVLTVYELPQSFSTAPTLQDDFQSGNDAAWTRLAGSQWTVPASGVTRVYRQSSTTGDAGALLTGSDRTDQAIQADMVARSFAGANRWFGLVTRYTDASNHYYVTLRNSNRIELRRMVNGEFRTLASAALSVAVGQRYRVNLESVGTSHRVYVNGRQMLVAYDDALTHGLAGVKMYRASAEFDNVIVSAGPRTTIHPEGSFWSGYEQQGGQWVDDDFPPTSISQTLTTGDARLLAGSPATTDQVMQSRIRLDGFGSGGQGWFGLFARYVDAANHYYVTLRSSNQLDIRRRVNGVTTVLASTPFTVNSTPRRVRFDVVGDRLRVFVDGTPTLETRDSSIAAGRVGIGGYRAAATWAESYAYQP